MDKVKVLVIHNQARVWADIHLRLSDDPAFDVFECDPYSDPLDMIDSNLPDIVLISTRSNQNWLDLGRRIARNYPNTKVIILSPNTNDEQIFNIIRIGAIACINTNNLDSELLDTLILASNGKYPINDALLTSPPLARRVLTHFHEAAYMENVASEAIIPLNKQEVLILNYAADGNTNEQIASLLQISEQTLKNYVSAILRKMNANDRALAVLKTTRGG